MPKYSKKTSGFNRVMFVAAAEEHIKIVKRAKIGKQATPGKLWQKPLGET